MRQRHKAETRVKETKGRDRAVSHIPTLNWTTPAKSMCQRIAALWRCQPNRSTLPRRPTSPTQWSRLHRPSSNTSRRSAIDELIAAGGRHLALATRGRGVARAALHRPAAQSRGKGRADELHQPERVRGASGRSGAAAHSAPLADGPGDRPQAVDCEHPTRANPPRGAQGALGARAPLQREPKLWCATDGRTPPARPIHGNLVQRSGWGIPPEGPHQRPRVSRRAWPGGGR